MPSRTMSAASGLDMLMQDTAYRRGAYDPFLMGY